MPIENGTTYSFTREIVNGSYNVDNPLDVDANGQAVSLSKRIEAALPGKTFSVMMSGTDVTVTFSQALSGGEQTTLTSTVSTHKAAAGTPSQQTYKDFLSPNGTIYYIGINNSGVVEVRDSNFNIVGA